MNAIDHPAESERTIGTLDMHPVKKQLVEVNIEVEASATTLIQRDRARVACLARISRHFNWRSYKASVDDAEHGS